MYHFTFIDEASAESEKNIDKKQENNVKNMNAQMKSTKATFSKTANFLHKYIEQNNNIRIFINKD